MRSSWPSTLAQINDAAGREYELELSIDETPQPTSLAEHYIIADQCRKRGVSLISLAPRFIGDFEKGVDYKGDLAAVGAIARRSRGAGRMLGPYKLSLHSGSDKLSLYPMLAKATRGVFHVKTAGTSYLEALRVVARHDEPLFRRIVDNARRHYDTDKATYHVSAEMSSVACGRTTWQALSNLEKIYLGNWADVPPGRGLTEPGRQVLHCTFGTVLMDPELGSAIRQLLHSHADTYTEILADHFSRHLRALTQVL